MRHDGLWMIIGGSRRPLAALILQRGTWLDWAACLVFFDTLRLSIAPIRLASLVGMAGLMKFTWVAVLGPRPAILRIPAERYARLVRYQREFSLRLSAYLDILRDGKGQRRSLERAE